MKITGTLKPGVFEIHGYTEAVKGYHPVDLDPFRYLVPCFELDQARAIMDQVNNSVDFYDVWDWSEPIHYDAETDTFHVYDPEAKTGRAYPGQLVTVEGRAVVVYSLGAWLWPWYYAD